MKKFILIIIILLINNCGYSPILKDINEKKFQIIVKKIDGDKSINKVINRKLKRYSQENIENIFFITANSSFKKTILSKDKTGRISDLNLSTKINFIIEYDNKNKSFNFEESLNIKQLSDFSEQKNYENKVKENLVDSIVGQLILKLNSI